MKSARIGTEVPTPDPVRETPPSDRFCDLILNGGVASGVVYPWALVELARHYRFRSIGGNSVGAMAAALAAAAEYGRCQGNAAAFEVLRRAPLQLADDDEPDRRTLMLRLFQPSAGVRRLFDLFLLGVRQAYGQDKRRWWWLVGSVLKLYGLRGWALAALVLLSLALLRALGGVIDDWAARVWVPLFAVPATLGFVACVVVVAVMLYLRVRHDLQALAANDYGLCSGRAQAPPGKPVTEAALIEWLHEGIQRSAGRGRDDPPLTFADLWQAPRAGQPAPTPRVPSIRLQMFSTNVTLGRPVRWPLEDGNPRLFFVEKQWERLFPPTLLKAVVDASQPYRPSGPSDPKPDPGQPEQFALMQRLREIPAGDLPIAVAARMSLCFPLLFSCVPVYAIDYTAPREERELRRCLMTDGGLCSNFPIHLFDAAHPMAPTFGLMLSRRLSTYDDEAVWLPEGHLAGRAYNWNRNVPGAELDGRPTAMGGLFGLLAGMVMTALDWNDTVTSRLPQVRNRVLRMALREGEGQLNIAMPRERILHMAHEYGTRGGLTLVERYVPPPRGAPTLAWQEHLYVRAMTELRVLRQHLRGYRRAVTAAGHNVPLAELIRRATTARPLAAAPGYAHADPEGARLTDRQADAVLAAVDAVAALERALDQPDIALGPYRPIPEPELRLRSPI